VYLLERTIGILVYVALLVVFSIVLANTDKKTRKILLIYTIILAIFAYIYIPSNTADLYRHFAAIERYSNYSIEQVFEIMTTSYTPAMVIIYYIIAKIGLHGLLPAMTAFIFYNNVFYIYSKTSDKYQLKGIKKVLPLIFIMSLGTYLEVISGIRTMLAFSMILRCFYEETFEGKSIFKNIIWYLISSTIHIVSVVVIFIRIVTLLLTNTDNNTKKSKFKNNIIKMALVAILILIFVFNGELIDEIINTGEYYLTNTVYSYIWEYIIMTLATVTVVAMKISNKNNDTDLKKLNMFSNINILLMLITFNSYSIFHRLGTFNIFLNIPVIFEYLKNEKETRKNYLLLFMSIAILLIACLRGNLCGFKFFVL